MSTDGIQYAVENDLDRDEFIDVLRRSTLAERRPVDEPERIDKMLQFANLIVTARDRSNDNLLVGISRCLTDFAFCCYCSDLAVDVAYQKGGIGRRLLEESESHAGDCGLFFLHAAPTARPYYPHIGMLPMDNAFKSAKSR